MIFEPTTLAGAVLVHLDRHVDERGFFARAWCAEEFAAASLPAEVAQCSVSWNEHRHTLRGMHWQAAPHGEGKLVRCTRGAILDVVVDLRPESSTYLTHVAVQLDQDNRDALVHPTRSCARLSDPGRGYGGLLPDGHGAGTGSGARRALGRPRVRGSMARPAGGDLRARPLVPGFRSRASRGEGRVVNPSELARADVLRAAARRRSTRGDG